MRQVTSSNHTGLMLAGFLLLIVLMGCAIYGGLWLAS
jgi:hypothetical protein